MCSRIRLIELNDCWRLLICIQLVMSSAQRPFTQCERKIYLFLWLSHFISILKVEFSFLPDIFAQNLLKRWERF